MNYNPVENLKTADYSRKMILEREQKIDDKIARATPSIPQNQPKGTKPNRKQPPYEDAINRWNREAAVDMRNLVEA